MNDRTENSFLKGRVVSNSNHTIPGNSTVLNSSQNFSTGLTGHNSANQPPTVRLTEAPQGPVVSKETWNTSAESALQ